MTTSSKTFRLAGLSVQVTLDGAAHPFEGPAWRKFEPFVCPEISKPDLIIALEIVDEVEGELIEPHAVSLGFLRIAPSADGRVHLAFSGGFDVWYQVGVGTGGHCFHNGIRQTDVVYYSLMRELPERGLGFLLHASAVAGPGGAVVFTGPSGAGKSTVASHDPEGTEVLSDDVVALLRSDHGWFVESLPIGGDLPPSGGRSVLRRVLFLEQADEDSIAPVSAARAVADVMRQVRLWSSDADVTWSVLDLVRDLVTAVPVGLLSCTRQSGFWPLLASDLGLDIGREEVGHG